MKNLQNIAKNDGIIALYQYDRDEHLIPVIVVTDQSLLDAGWWSEYDFDRYYGVIILTQDDIDQGSDAFALTFAHLQERSVFVAGEDNVLGAIELDTKHIRLHIEVLARQLLIDAREYRLRNAILQEYETYLLRADDRLRVGFDRLGHTYSHHLAATTSRSAVIQDLLAIVQEVDTMSA